MAKGSGLAVHLQNRDYSDNWQTVPTMLNKTILRLLTRRLPEELTVIIFAVVSKMISPSSTHWDHYCVEADLKRRLYECAVIETVN
jgi:hypothetical protein